MPSAVRIERCGRGGLFQLGLGCDEGAPAILRQAANLEDAEGVSNGRVDVQSGCGVHAVVSLCGGRVRSNINLWLIFVNRASYLPISVSHLISCEIACAMLIYYRQLLAQGSKWDFKSRVDKWYLNEGTTDMENSIGDLINSAGELVSDIGSGLPVPIKKNLFKAFSQLCTAAVDVPVAHLEGKAAEKRAETAARIVLINESTRQIASRLNVDEGFVHAAANKFSENVVRGKINLNVISRVALEDLQSDRAVSGNEDFTKTSEEPVIGDDWLNEFEREASTKSSEDMQLLFARILAGEIRKPASFSIRTIRLVSQLDSSTAAEFARLCSMTTSITSGGRINDARVILLDSGTSRDPFLTYDLSYETLLQLQEYGLLTSTLETSMDYKYCIAGNEEKTFGFRYGGKMCFLHSVKGVRFSELLLGGPTLSSAGKELLKIVDIAPNQKYTDDLERFFALKDLRLIMD